MRHLQLLILSLALLLSACGFHLRGLGSFQLAFEQLELTADDSYASISRAVGERLQSQGVELTPNAEFRLHLGHEQFSSRKVGGSPGSHSADYQLSSSLDYSIRAGTLPDLVNGKLQATRNLSINQNQASASDEEERLLRNEIRDELVMQLMLRLQSLQPEQLRQRKEEELRKREAQQSQERQLEQLPQSPDQSYAN